MRICPGANTDLADVADSTVSMASTRLLPLVRPVKAVLRDDWLVATLNPDYL